MNGETIQILGKIMVKIIKSVRLIKKYITSLKSALFTFEYETEQIFRESGNDSCLWGTTRLWLLGETLRNPVGVKHVGSNNGFFGKVECNFESCQRVHCCHCYNILNGWLSLAILVRVILEFVFKAKRLNLIQPEPRSLHCLSEDIHGNLNVCYSFDVENFFQMKTRFKRLSKTFSN